MTGYREKNGGGFLGAAIAAPLNHLFGKIGAVLFIVAILIVLLLLITGKAIFHSIQNKTVDSYRKIDRIHQENKAEREKERQFRKAMADKKAYEEFMSKPKIYKAGTDAIEPDYSEKDRDTRSFVEKLKESSTMFNEYEFKSGKEKQGFVDLDYEPAQEAGPVKEKEKKKHFIPAPVVKSAPEEKKPEPAHDLDMVEISSPDQTNRAEKSVYESEMERKFGKSSAASIKNDADFAQKSYDDNISKEGYADDYEPVIGGNVYDDISSSYNSQPETAAKTAGGSFGYSGDSKEGSAYAESGLFARGDYSPAGSSEISNHSLKGSQTVTENSLPDNAKSGSAAIVKKAVPKEKKPYVFPPASLLKKSAVPSKGTSRNELKDTAAKLKETLSSFGVNVTITNVTCGPTITRYELQPEIGVKVSRITSLSDDIKLSLAAEEIRIEAPIPGKSAVGIEVPNKVNESVEFRTLVESEEFKNSKSNLTFGVGKDIGGKVIVTDIAKMPHLLVAGQTGAGKSVCINTLIMSIIYKSSPDDVRMILVDPKVVELSVYNGLPHLLIPVVTDPKKAAGALNWAVAEMTSRYEKFAELGVRDLAGFNRKVGESKEQILGKNGEIYEKMPQIIFIIDELADLMMVAPKEIEEYIIRLTQLARACGIHLIIATQRPSVNVITGLIKANVPSRIACKVASQVDSRTIIDMAGAEKLIGKGDMLFFPSGIPKPVRVQGAFVSDQEVMDVVEYLKEHNSENDTSEMEKKVSSTESQTSGSLMASSESSNDASSEYDELLYKAGMFIIEKEKASIGALQRQFRIGFNRAARIMDQLADLEVVGPEEGTKPRQIRMSIPQFEEFAAANRLV